MHLKITKHQIKDKNKIKLGSFFGILGAFSMAWDTIFYGVFALSMVYAINIIKINPFLAAIILYSFKEISNLVMISFHKGVSAIFKDIVNFCFTKFGLYIIIAAFLSDCVGGICYAYSSILSPFYAVIFVSISPIIAIMINYFLNHERINKLGWFGVLIAIVIVLIIVIDSQVNTNNGLNIDIIIAICFALITAIGWGMEGCVANYVYKKSKIEANNLLSIKLVFNSLMSIGIIIPLFSLILTSNVLIGWDWLGIGIKDPVILGIFLAVGLVEYVSRVGFFSAVKYLKAGFASILDMMNVGISPLLILIFSFNQNVANHLAIIPWYNFLLIWFIFLGGFILWYSQTFYRPGSLKNWSQKFKYYDKR